MHVFLKLLDLSKLHVRPPFLPTQEYFTGVMDLPSNNPNMLIPEICQMREEGLSVHWILQPEKEINIYQ